MASSKNAPKSVKTASFPTLENLYSVVIESGINAKAEALNFIVELDKEMKSGLTQADAQATMREMAAGLARPLVTHSHVPSISTAAAIINKNFADMDKFSVAKVLSVATRVLADVKASGVKSHLAKFDTFAELDKGTKSKAESQADAKGEAVVEEMEELAKDITLEVIVDALDAYLKGHDLKSLTTTELEKLHSVIGRLVQVEKNTKALVA